MAQIIKRGERRWLVRIALGKDAAGTRQFLSRTIYGTKKEAQAWAAGHERDKVAGTFVRPSTVTLDLWLDTWLKTGAATGWGKRTSYIAEQYARLYIRPHLGRRRLSELGPAEVQAWVATLASTRLAPATWRRAFGLLRSALNTAVRLRQLAVSPCAGVVLPKAARREMTALGPEAAARFLAAAEGTKYGALLALLLHTGLRPGEALALRWADLDLEGGHLVVRRALVRVGRAVTFAEPKTKQARTVPLAPGLVKRLKAHFLASRHKAPEALVFGDREGEPLEIRGVVKDHFKRVLVAAKLPTTIRLYDLRHTAATLLLSTGTPIKAASEILGHASAAMTLNVYAHALSGQTTTAVERLEAALTAAGTASERAGTPPAHSGPGGRG